MTETLTVVDVVAIHEQLARDFARQNDPISPSGVREMGLLESAVGRQHVGYGSIRKYHTVFENSATLTFGVCNNHAFHNGNKRTALVTMLAHLDKNGYTIRGVKQKELFSMILAVANQSMTTLVRDRSLAGSKLAKTDREVAALAVWIRQRASQPRKGEKQVTYRELRRLLRPFKIELRSPAGPAGNKLDIYCERTERKGLFGRQVVMKRVGAIGYHDEGSIVAKNDLRKLRELCGIREEDGVDSSAFYDQQAVIEGFVNEYRSVLKRLAAR